VRFALFETGGDASFVHDTKAGFQRIPSP
jgi:hypothetical protein